MKYLAKVNPKYFAAIELYAARSDVRYYLNGVCIEPHPEKGVVIIGTNGHTLAAIHDPDGFCKERIIVGDITRSLVAACKAKGRSSDLFSTPTHLWISETSAVVMGVEAEEVEDPFGPGSIHASKISLVDGKFPDWRKVLPKSVGAEPGDPLGPLPVQGQYLQQLYAASKILCPKHQTVHLRNTAAGMTVARIGEQDIDQRFVAILMGVRYEPLPTLLPPTFMPKSDPESPQTTTPKGTPL